MTSTTLPPNPRRGELWLVNFDPTTGAEIQNTRPAVVLSTDAVGRLPLRIVVPITDWKPHYEKMPWIVYVPLATGNRLSKDSGADAFQIKSLSVQRFVQRLGVLTPEQIDQVAAAIALCVGYVP